MFELPVKKDTPFRDREEAGQKLAEKLLDQKIKADLVLAIPRGGIPVAVKVAQRLNIPFDVQIVKKLQIPEEPEAGFGAVTADGSIVLNEQLIKQLKISPEEVRIETDRQEREARRSLWLFKQGKLVADVKNKNVLLVDDGLASGYSMLAAINFLKRFKAKKIIVAVPTAQVESYEMVRQNADNAIVLSISTKKPYAVADSYKYWWDLTDEEALKYLSDLDFQKKSA